MTCGYQNSAGTDLDNLFYINNGNAGALGFLVSNGQDLGNRYSNLSTLGYSVGYKNSAGTDLGYLRGSISSPATVSISQAYGISNQSAGFYYSEHSDSESSWTVCDGTYLKGTITLGMDLAKHPGGALNWVITIFGRVNDTKGCTDPLYASFNDNSTVIPQTATTYVTSHKGGNSGPWGQAWSNTIPVNSTSFRRQISFYFHVTNCCSGYYNSSDILIRHYLQNAAGSSSVFSFGYTANTKGWSVGFMGTGIWEINNEISF